MSMLSEQIAKDASYVTHMRLTTVIVALRWGRNFAGGPGIVGW